MNVLLTIEHRSFNCFFVTIPLIDNLQMTTELEDYDTDFTLLNSTFFLYTGFTIIHDEWEKGKDEITCVMVFDSFTKQWTKKEWWYNE